ncbi:hypothetical protein J9253_00055 [Thiothrix litoralis]|uniref:Uncharacterized protein n=1 Tax=Thiothrix litoralis TaxID=2891210 RepID=A0ABX7WV69_9GAMM|nr:hypothetical protein [Thiothrix litoralis]QTR46393.1 hypothetical protein J9253_00055 [Thiothrix litoralis]
MRNAKLPDWEQVLSAAARLQRILPEAVLVGGTASAIYAQYSKSTSAKPATCSAGHHPSASMQLYAKPPKPTCKPDVNLLY